MRITRSTKRKGTDDARNHQSKPPTVRSVDTAESYLPRANYDRRKLGEERRRINLPFLLRVPWLKMDYNLAGTRAKKSFDLEGQFQYQPLSSQRNEIRLLRILPVRKFDGLNCGIECNISHVSLDDLPDYHALSYAWGEKLDLRSISLEGHPFNVTANLYGALSRLQTSSMTGPIWIDAICINQDNLQERSEQVVKMGDIFKQAAKVVTWLGDADKESELAFSLLQNLKDCLHDRDSCRRILLDKKNLDSLYGLYSLFYREYWWRVWVIQEVTFAKMITILCGGDSFLWSDLVAIQETLVRHHLRDIDFIAHETPKLSFLRVSIESRGPRAMFLSMEHGRSDLAQTLLQHRFKESSDPKDKIYSLVGLSSAHRDPRFIVDYSKSVCQVYTDVVEYVVTTTKKLDIICAMPRGLNPYKLPSWVPDWSFHGLGSSLLEHSSKHQFSAAGTSEAEANVSSDKTILHAKGVSIGSITLIGVACGMEDLEDEQHAAIAFHEWQTLIAGTIGEYIALGECLCRNIIQEKYKTEELKEWTTKSDFLPWILGTFVRAMVVVRPDVELDPHLAYYRDYRADWRSPDEDQVLGMILLKGAAEMMFGRRIFISDSRLLGLGPESIVEGDTIAVLLGCQLPIILRPGSDQYTYLGEAFVDGYMYGGTITKLTDGYHELKDFEIR